MKQNQCPKWQFDRAGLLTSSQFAAAAGLSPFKSRIRLWKELTGKVPIEPGNIATEFGEKWEPVAINQYEIDTGVIVSSCGFIRHPTIEWIGTTPDGMVGIDGQIECKCPFRQVHYDEIPTHYQTQVFGSLECTQRKWCDFFSWVRGEIRITRVYRDTQYWEWLLPLLEEFWHFVKTDSEPPKINKKPVFIRRDENVKSAL